MDTPKTQQELLRVILEQGKQIQSLKNAMKRMEQKLQKVAMTAESNRHKTQRLGNETRILSENIARIHQRLV